ncbi:HNH endonuclease [Paenibacillus senegalimassiliensis]|uniref:HNH endonuclease n=1 Tax=Paenibacillus senegalimassiliensis TaxID=1737426 RepID=UPI000B113C69|nr:HNH endonuclease signature motif containing protein [Paenibacillus senegalimassiliensis]
MTQQSEQASTPAKAVKICAYCGETRPVGEFLRRTGKRSGKGERRGACRACRAERKRQAMAKDKHSTESDYDAKPQDSEQDVHKPFNGGRTNILPQTQATVPGAEPAETAPTLVKQVRKRKRKRRRGKTGTEAAALARGNITSALQDGENKAGIEAQLVTRSAAGVHAAPKRRIKRALPAPPPRVEGPDVRTLRPNKNGMIRMRGRTDKGRRWQQEVELELAVTLVREHMAVIVNPFTIRRLYTNKAFRRYILNRDNYTCFFCGEYGDTIDHLLPKAKGGHTTPVNCVCACNLCNQSKADRFLEDFIEDDVYPAT